MTSRAALGLFLLLSSSVAAACASPNFDEPLPLDDSAPRRPHDKADAGEMQLDPTSDAGPTKPVVSALLDKQARPRGVAVDDQFVYYASMDDKAIYKVPVAGGARTRVDVGGPAVTEPWVHAVDDTYVYFANTGSASSVARVRKAGGPSETLVANVKPWSLTIDASNIYFTDQPLTGKGSIRKIAKSCTLPCTATVLVPEQEFPLGIATDGSFVYWANQAATVTYAYPGGPETSRVWEGTLRKWSVSLTTTNPAATTLVSSLKAPSGVAIGGGRVFVATNNDGVLRAVTPAGGDEVTISTKAGTAYFMAADETHVYWLSGGAGSKADVYRSPKDHGAAEWIADGQDGPIGLAIGKTAVYWANLAGGQIMRASK